MADFNQLKADVANQIKTNGVEAITGAVMQDVLLTIINSIADGYMFGGVAQHSGDVGNPDYNVFYLGGSGSYTGYGESPLNVPDGCYCVMMYNGTWHQYVVDLGVHLTGEVAEGETQGVTGDKINTALNTLFTTITNILDSLEFVYNTPAAQQGTKAMLDATVTLNGVPRVLATLVLGAATAEAAGLLSAEDKAKLDAILANIRSMVIVDTTESDDEGGELTETLKWTVNGAEEVICAFTILAATTSKAGLLSADDKAKLDGIYDKIRTLSFRDATSPEDEATKLVEALSATLGSSSEDITTFQLLAATASKAGLLSAADKAKLDALWSSGYQFAGIATPSTTPISTTSKIFYIATEAGTYFDTITVTQGINILLWDGTAWSAVQVVGIDDEITGGSTNTPESNAVIKAINEYQDIVGKLSKQEKLSNINYIDNTYIGEDGGLHHIEPDDEYHYISLYKLPISDLQRIELADIKASGYSRLILYDSSGDIVYNNNCSTSLYVIDNSAGLYHFLSVGTNIIPAKMEITVTPFAIDIDTYPTDIVCPVPIPDDLKNSRLLIDNVYYGEVSGYHSVSGLYIRNYQKLCFIPYRMRSDYQKIWLTKTDGTVTSIDYPEDGCITIDNNSGDYAYISYNARDGKPALYASGVASIDQEISDIRKNVSDCDANSHVATEKFVNVVSEKYLIYDVYIDNFGRPVDIAPTESGRYYSVMFFPVRKYDYFWVSGNTTTDAYIKTYDSDLNEIGSTQGKNVMFDNSNHSISYISFTSRSSESSLYINTQHEVSVRDAASMSIPSYVEIEPEWIDNKFINADNELASISQAETYHYKAAKDIFVKDATKISWDLIFGGIARVVTSDIEGNIISVYTEEVNEIDNESGNIAFISICNNFVRNDIPILKLYKVPTIKEAVESLIKANSVSSPLSNKNIAVLGDSIMMIMSQGGVDEGEVTYVGTDDETYDISELTNIGGLLYVTSTLEDGEIVSTTIQADVHNSNQEVLDTESWIPLKDALNANHVINTGRGGATITGNAITTAYPAFGETSFNTMPNHCLELKRRVDAGEPTPDVIMMWAGTNDVRKFLSGNTWIEPTNFDEIMALDYETQLLANTSTAMEYKKTIYGALRFCLEFLYRNFPNATVIFFSPIQSIVSPRTYDRERKIGSYIKKMAERYGALFVDACVEIGIADKIDTLDNHVWLFDGLHPNAAGKILYCNYTAKKLKNIAALKQ